MRDKRDGRFAPMGVMPHVTLFIYMYIQNTSLILSLKEDISQFICTNVWLFPQHTYRVSRKSLVEVITSVSSLTPSPYLGNVDIWTLPFDSCIQNCIQASLSNELFIKYGRLFGVIFIESWFVQASSLPTWLSYRCELWSDNMVSHLDNITITLSHKSRLSVYNYLLRCMRQLLYIVLNWIS